MELKKWRELLWAHGDKWPIVFCPKHRLRLEVFSNYYGRSFSQESVPIDKYQNYLICPENEEHFLLFGGGIATMRQRFTNYEESLQLKNAKIYDLDNIYTPVLRVDPKPKDTRFSIQVEIDETPNGKKMVIYAADRNDVKNKTQIFIDPEHDKLSFDSNDLHPNAIFAKVEATFKDGNKSILDSHSI